ncbi:MAG TPA: heme o synthase [Stellaceae bacterium]|nr:heme o synthase [Stellaceae bacterium]
MERARVLAAAPAPSAAVPSIGDYVALLKPRVMSLVVFTGWAGLYLAPGHLHPVLAFTAVLCIAVAAGAAGAINMWYDRDIDAVMERTRDRPLPAGRMAPGDALGFGVVLAVGSVLMMALALNLVAAALLALTIAFYVFIYTIWLKRRTPQNIVIGGAAGAFPPLVGWAAATGQVALPALALFALIFFWTPPHFWALSLYRAGDYAKAGVPMLPVVAGARETRKQMLLYTLVLWPVAVSPSLLGIAGWVYGAAALALSAVFTGFALRVMRDPRERAAKEMFGFSILYLFLLFALLVADRIPAIASAVGS